MITNKLYHRLRKLARGNIDFIEDFSLGHAENLPPKWQSRESAPAAVEQKSITIVNSNVTINQ
jgi:hypothetical protein